MKDLIIVGAGPAGMTASIYASRYKLEHLVIGQAPGGQGMLAGQVENYPGFPSIAGPELMQKLLEHTKSYNVQIRNELVKQLKRESGFFKVITEQGEEQTKTLILAMGASYKSLGVPGEKELIGKGVSYCANCDAPLFKEKIVAVVGGSNAAVGGALHVAAFASKVYLIHRRDEFRAVPYLVEKMKQNSKIEQVLSTQITQIMGTNKVESVVLDKPYQGQTKLAVDGVFIEIGQVPATALADGLGVQLDEQGFIKVSPGMATNIPGVFAAGDLSVVPGEQALRQLITAAADGARAAASVYQYLHKSGPSPSWGE
jgi:thioredoxin reductase (NADPH)